MSLPKTNTAFISYEFSFHKEKVNPEFISKEWFTEKICKKHKIYWHMYFRWLIYFSYLLTSNKYRRMKYEFNFHWKNLFILIIKQDENFENLVIGGKDSGIMAVKAVVRRMLVVMLNDWCWDWRTKDDCCTNRPRNFHTGIKILVSTCLDLVFSEP